MGVPFSLQQVADETDCAKYGYLLIQPNGERLIDTLESGCINNVVPWIRCANRRDRLERQSANTVNRLLGHDVVELVGLTKDLRRERILSAGEL
jgi:hypothetical protein